MLYIARDKEELGYEGNAIAVGKNQELILFNAEPTPTPLAAGVDNKNVRCFSNIEMVQSLTS